MSEEIDCELCNCSQLEQIKTARSSNMSAGRADPDSLLDLFWDPLSQPSRSVKLFLVMCGIPHTDRFVHIKYGENLESQFKKVSSLGRVPVIKSGEFVLSESAAIYDYLSTKFSHLCPDWLFPSQLEQRSRVNEYLHWHHNNLRLNSALLFQETFVKPKFKGIPASEEKTSRYEKGLKKALTELGSYFLQDKTFIATELRPSIADIHGVCELMQLRAIGFNFTHVSTKIEFWMQKTIESLNPHFDEIHEEILKLGKPTNKL
ncbi:uncharacterized protein LOC134847983 [Symsagittifera roscoffensis]|uniref:uncharacterized protein LOC134847983 n=1 Tax=Symsagittifera roscoffensis TaxID=84072 RepID=UPI00307B2AC0